MTDFALENVSDSTFRALWDDLAPAFAKVPGLVAKVWLADPRNNQYRGIYTWEDKESMEAFTKTELFASVVSPPLT